MAEVLDQSEVDALLAAVEAGEVEADTESVGARPAPWGREVQLYDFKRPERVSKEQMRSLEGIHESFARNFGASTGAPPSSSR